MKGTILKRGKSWAYVVDIGLDEKGIRKQKTKSGFRTKKLAQDGLAKLVNEKNEGTYFEPTKLTVIKYFNDFLEIKKLEIRQSTFMTYNSVIKNHIIPYFNRKELNSITPLEISKMYVKLSENNTSATLSEIHKILSLSLKHAVKLGIIKSNPMSLVKKPKPIKKELSVWTKDESREFLNQIKGERLYPIFHLALSTGMRQSELLGLRWKDISFENATLQVVQTLSHDGKQLLPLTKTKSGKRLISLNENTLSILKMHRKTILEERLKCNQYTDLDLVFCSSVGTPTFARNLTRTFYQYLVASKVKKIKFHDLRHTFATLLLGEGIHPKVVAEMLGHADMRTTLEVYSHVSQNMQDDVAKKVELFFL